MITTNNEQNPKKEEAYIVCVDVNDRFKAIRGLILGLRQEETTQRCSRQLK